MLRYGSFTFYAVLALTVCLGCSLFIASDGTFVWKQTDASWYLLRDVRLPRAMTAAFSGGAVAVAGALSQAVFRNALATPSVLGTEAGASLGLAVYIATVGVYASSESIALATVAGAGAATIVSLSFARGTKSLVRMLLGGFALNAFLGAGCSLITSWLLEQGHGNELYHWLLGSFSSRTWSHASFIAIVFAACSVAAVYLAKYLDILSLGAETAETLGVQVSKLHVCSLSLMAILVGSSMAVGGPLPFVGLVVPHFVRMSTGPYMKPLLLNTFLAGATLTLFSDLLARLLRYPVELSVGLLTTIMGAPYFIFLLRRQTST